MGRSNQDATAAQINDAACEWYFDREITKECEMAAAQWRTTDPDATAELLKCNSREESLYSVSTGLYRM